MVEAIRSYRDLKVWRKGIDLVKYVYALIAKFPKNENYGLSDQLRRASVSIPSNIAEGQARQHTGEFKQFLHVALGSAAEVDTQIVIALELGYITQEEADCVDQMLGEIRRMISSLMSHLPSR